MKKLIFSIFAALTMMFASSSASAQQMPPVPMDTAIIYGKLDNGLTYYIRHNESPKGLADFFIAQNVGSILEEDNQRGLAHFLEHMCFNGTKNFPGNQVVDWLETVGVKFGRNLNAYTSIDKTVYNISKVPVARKSVQDSCLLILHDWANDLLLDPKEIDSERGVIHEEWRRSNTGVMRIYEKLLPVIYPNNKYGYRLPIGTMEVVDNFAPQALRDYYEKWYRPDNQAIIVVGDIDPKYIESKIKEMFSPIKMPENPAERYFVPVEDTPGTIYAIGTDPEMQYSIASMMFKFKDKMLPDEFKPTMAYYTVEFMKSMVDAMLNQRLDEIGNKPDAPFSQAGANVGDFFLSKTKDALTLQTVGKGNDIVPALQAAYRELLRAKQHGFTVTEYDRAKADYLSRLEKAYNQRAARENTEYCEEYAANFTEGDPIPGIEFEYNIMQQIANAIPVEAINSILPEVITDDNRVVLVMLPEDKDVVVPTEESLAAAIAEVNGETIEAYKEELKAEPLVPALPKAVKVKSIKDNEQWDAKELTFKNGVKVIVKPTKFKEGEIVFDAIAKGGTAAVGDELANELKFMPLAMSANGLGTYNNTDLTKYLQGKQTSLDFQVDKSTRELEGKTTPKNLQTLMELIYMTFTDFEITDEDFAATQARFAGILANQEKNPQYIFQRDLNKSLYASEAMQALTPDAINAADRAKTLEIVRSMLANPADYTFAFVGDIDMDTFVPLAEQYLGTLKTGKSVAYTPNAARDLRTGTFKDVYSTPMETPQTWTFIGLSGKLPYTPANKLLASAAGQVLTKRLVKKIREEMGATYSISAGAYLTRLNENNFVLQIPFPMKPEKQDEVLVAIDEIMNDMANNVTADEFNTVKEYMIKSATESLEKNEDWSSAIAATTLNGVDTFNSQIETINALTPQDVQNLMKSILEQKNHFVILLEAAK